MKLQAISDLSINQFETQIPTIKCETAKKVSTFKKLTKMNSLNKNTNKNGLKKMLKKGKTQIISSDFKNRLKRLIIPSKVPMKLLNIQMEPSNKWEVFKHKLEETQGLQISFRMTIAWALLNLVQTILIAFVASVMLAFQENKNNKFFVVLIYISCFLHFIDIFLNSSLQRIQNGRKMKNLKQIYSYYAGNQLKIDLLYFTALIMLPLNIHISLDMLIQVLVFIKMFKSVNRVGLFQHMYLTIMSMEKYYQVIKVLLLNFLIAHIIAIVLILISQLSQDNWLVRHNLQHTQWSQKYIWSYYWGVTIMLTVGFGDFAATNKNQALLLIFIETVSCILLAYNINTVGVILNQIRMKQRQRKKKLRVFMKMADEQKISSSLTKQIASFIGQSFQIKDKFQFQQYQSVVQSLPPMIKSQLKMQSNKNIFSSIPFLNLLCKKSLMNLAEKIRIKIAHPQQIIYKKGQLYNLTILKKGQLALCCKIGKQKYIKSKLNGWAIKTFISKSFQDSKLLSLDFLKNRICNYDVKSLDYSVIYEMTMDQLIQVLRDSHFDYQLLCQTRDKQQYYLNDNQIYLCEYCINQKHSVSRCPKIQYIPLKRFVIIKYNNKLKDKKYFSQSRNKNFKRQKNNLKPLQNTSIIQCEYEVFVEINFADNKNISISKGGSSKAMKKLIKSTCEKRYKQTLLECKNSSLMNSISLKECSLKELDIKYYQSNSFERLFGLQCDMAENFHHYFKNNNPQSTSKVVLSSSKQKKLTII